MRHNHIQQIRSLDRSKGIFGPPLIYLRQKEMFTNAKPAAAKQG